jgi:outer membrane protein assembly factor BamB
VWEVARSLHIPPDAFKLTHDENQLIWGGDNSGITGDGPVLIYNTTDGTLIRSIKIPQFKIYSISLTRDDLYCYVAGVRRTGTPSNDKGAYFMFNVQTGALIWSINLSSSKSYINGVHSILENEYGGGNLLIVMPNASGPNVDRITLMKIDFNGLAAVTA